MRTRDRVALAAIALALTAAGLLVGGATRWAALVVAALALGAAAVHVTSRRTPSHLGPLVGLVLVALVATAAQLLPLPRAIAAIVAADKLALVTDHASALGEPPPTWVVASHDAPATLVELAKLCGYLALAWGCTRIASQRRARPWLAASVVGAASAVAVVAMAHRVLGATALYGVWQMPHAGMIPAPLINENHLAALAALAVPLAVGLGLAWRDRRRALALSAALLLATTVALTSSRGGLVGLVSGLVVAGIVLVAQRRAGLADDHRPAPLAVTAPALVVAACALTLFGVVAAKDVALELGGTQLTELTDHHSKFQVWRASTPMIVDNRWVGIGRGSFEATFPRHAQVGDVTFSHAENSYLQAVIDWGVLAGAALALALALLGRAALRRWRHGPLEAGALGALAAIAIHELADFSLEMPAVAMAVIATAALVAPTRLGTDDKRAPVARTILLRRAGLIAAGLAVVILAATPLGRGARVERAALPAATAPGALAAARHVMARHPADGLAVGHVAEALFVVRDPRAPAVIGRALYLRPAHGGLHLLAARMLMASQRPRQAAIEYAAAIADERDVTPIVDEVLARLPDAAAAERALPDERYATVRASTTLIMRQRFDVLYLYMRRITAAHPDRDQAFSQLAVAALALGKPAEALAAAQTADRQHPTTLTALAVAQALAALDRKADAIDVLRRAPPSAVANQRATVATNLAALLRSGGDLAAAREVLDAAAAGLSDHPLVEAQVRRQLGAVEDALGHPNQAEWERRRAAELESSK